MSEDVYGKWASIGILGALLGLSIFLTWVTAWSGNPFYVLVGAFFFLLFGIDCTLAWEEWRESKAEQKKTKEENT